MKKTYTTSQKKAAVKYAVRHSIKEAAKKWKCSPISVSNWKRQYDAGTLGRKRTRTITKTSAMNYGKGVNFDPQAFTVVANKMVAEYERMYNENVGYRKAFSAFKELI